MNLNLEYQQRNITQHRTAQHNIATSLALKVQWNCPVGQFVSLHTALTEWNTPI